MKVLIDKTFERDIRKITDKKVLHSIALSILEIQKLNTLLEIEDCKKLKGSKNAYRIRIGDYRLGFIFEKQSIEFIRCLHRSKNYEHFPG